MQCLQGNSLDVPVLVPVEAEILFESHHGQLGYLVWMVLLVVELVMHCLVEY